MTVWRSSFSKICTCSRLLRINNRCTNHAARDTDLIVRSVNCLLKQCARCLVELTSVSCYSLISWRSFVSCYSCLTCTMAKYMAQSGLSRHQVLLPLQDKLHLLALITPNRLQLSKVTCCIRVHRQLLARTCCSGNRGAGCASEN